MNKKTYQTDYTPPNLEEDTAFLANSKSLAFKLLDFWKWNQSNLIENRTRGILAEFIVKMALDINSPSRLEWDAYDFETQTEKGKVKIEVKSAAYIQAWAQKKLSSISFGIAPTKGLLQDGNYSETYKRQADIYIFCLLDHKDQATINPLDMDQWCFYLAPTSLLDKELGPQKSLSLARLKKLGLKAVKYSDLKARFEAVVGGVVLFYR
ncbi:hypothetical protein [Saprospira grandis]|uniref:Restriction endonuclease n=1 Tax=Saprospira grandis (strain Lewin) TaxID=984262 RepID=H6L1Q5_SAPGL|nr:hypothetical protein [Saprospira grandis]AFC26133.1 hypothetical protein SGRA_3408 [Saprospira grandis str. Lewin]